MTQLEKLKKLLGIPLDDNSKDFLLEFTLDKARDMILNYCHISEVPQGLENIMIGIAMDLYRSENLGNEEKSLGSISSISEGDTTVSYSSNNYNTAIGAGGADFIKNYKIQLNKYRKLVW